MFPSREDLLEWVRRVGYGHGFVIVIIRSDIANGKQGFSVTGTRKCECPLKLRGKPVGKGQGWVSYLPLTFYGVHIVTQRQGYGHHITLLGCNLLPN